MFKIVSGLVGIGFLVSAFTLINAQPPGDGGKKGFGKGNSGTNSGLESFLSRLMVYDANKDGKLSKSELTDERLHALFTRADANQDGYVTKEELTSL